MRASGTDMPVAAQTYSILPRMLELIERLLPRYEKRGTVLKAELVCICKCFREHGSSRFEVLFRRMA